MYSTCTFYEQFLPMATQQRPGQEGGEVHKNLPQQRGHLLQSALKLGGDTMVEKKVRERWREYRSEDKISNIQIRAEEHVRKNSGDTEWVGKEQNMQESKYRTNYKEWKEGKKASWGTRKKQTKMSEMNTDDPKWPQSESNGGLEWKALCLD